MYGVGWIAQRLTRCLAFPPFCAYVPESREHARAKVWFADALSGREHHDPLAS